MRTAACFAFSVKDNWINDPAGLVYIDGEYHLFYQLNPYGLEWGNMHWGHAVSEDLIEWRHLPISIYPHPELGMAFTGSVVVDIDNSSGLFKDTKHGLVALLTTALSVTGTDALYQTQSLAYSSDRGVTWKWYKENPVIDMPHLDDFRDPKVFRYERDNCWVMVVSGGNKVLFFKSANLKNWNRIGEYSINVGEGVCECPDLVKMKCGENQMWVLFFSIGNDKDSRKSGVYYVPGTFNGTEFQAWNTDISPMDVGPDFYALQSWYGLLEETIVIAWANNPAYSHRIPKVFPGRAGVLARARSLYLHEISGCCMLQQRPAHCSTELQRVALSVQALEKNSDCYVISGDQTIELVFESGKSEFTTLELFLYSGEKMEFSLTYVPEENSIKIIRNAFVEGVRDTFIEHEKEFALIEGKEDFQLRMVFNKKLLELYLYKGLVVGTYQLFIESQRYKLITKTSRNKKSQNVSMDVNELIPKKTNTNHGNSSGEGGDNR
ncbi:MAG: glycoside hydrolase family 32 protein [Spirochaetia bacterium]